MKSNGWKARQEETQTATTLSLWSKIVYWLFGYQTKSFIGAQLLEPRALPQGGTEFEEWSDRILSGAMITADPVSLKFGLANMITHLGPTESHKPDAFFIHMLKKSAANQVAVSKIEEYKKFYEDRKKQKDEEAKAATDPETSPSSDRAQ